MILYAGTSSFILSLSVHILVWRRIRPVKQVSWLAVIFIAAPLLLYAVLPYIHSLALRPAGHPDLLFKVIFAFLWHFILSSFYIASYPLFQAKCPSLKIILTVSSSMPEGISVGSIHDLFSEDTLLNDRLKDLTDDKLIYLKDGKWELSTGGRLLSRLFSGYRRLLGLPPGEG